MFSDSREEPTAAVAAKAKITINGPWESCVAEQEEMTTGGKIDLESTYSPPSSSSASGRGTHSSSEESGSASCCCCFNSNSSATPYEVNKTKEEEEKKKELNRGLCGTRWSTILMMVLWIFSVIISRIKLGWSGIECDMSADDDSVTHDCIVHSAIFRASSVVVFLFGVQVLVSPCFVHIFDDYWILKIVYCVGATAGLLVPSGANFFDDAAYAYIARIGGFIFIIFLQTVVLDFAYYWKQSWIDRSTVAGRMTSATLHGGDVMNVMSSFWHCALLIVSLIYLIIFVISMAVLFTFFGGKDCAASNSILTITLVLMVAALVLQMFLTKNGSIIASGVLASYGLFFKLCLSYLLTFVQLLTLLSLLFHSILIEHATPRSGQAVCMVLGHKLLA